MSKGYFHDFQKTLGAGDTLAVLRKGLVGEGVMVEGPMGPKKMIYADYIASGGRYFTAETHIRHLDEVHAGARIRVETQCLLGEGKKMHLFHRMWEGERLLATGEHMLIHVSLRTRRASEPEARVAGPLGRVAEAHGALPVPEGAGAAVGKR